LSIDSTRCRLPYTVNCGPYRDAHFSGAKCVDSPIAKPLPIHVTLTTGPVVNPGGFCRVAKDGQDGNANAVVHGDGAGDESKKHQRVGGDRYLCPPRTVRRLFHAG
jgi:hypothetical protein